jgi:hypothetical protein
MKGKFKSIKLNTLISRKKSSNIMHYQEDRLFASAERIEKNGLKNAMILERYEEKKATVDLSATKYKY